MAKMPRSDKKKLLVLAREVAAELKARAVGTQLRVRLPSRTVKMITDGWAARIGGLGSGRPRMEIWLDRFSGHADRKLWACFSSGTRSQMDNITKYVNKKLIPVRVVTHKDTNTHGNDSKPFALLKKLPNSCSNQPILEKYRDGETFYGFYDLTQSASGPSSQAFIKHAAAFFESVGRALPNATAEEDSQEAYPRYENRKRIISHLRRERSRLLATQRKEMDHYQCQVCYFSFLKLYGPLGAQFAEAHHLVPLGKLRENVITKIEDLVTVCANCHRMLHRMEGIRKDVVNLRKIVHKRQGKGR